MKVIYIMADTFRRDHVSIYGNPPWTFPAGKSVRIHTPNLERFASQAAVFDNAYIGSFPTVPNRRDTLLGRSTKGMPFNGWRRLDTDETTFLKYLTEKKIPSMLITDTQNNVTRDMNLYRDFTAWTVNRGQEGDVCWMDENVPLVFPVPHHLIRYKAEMWHQILMNRAHRRVETDWFAPSTYKTAMDWLERNYKRENFFLWIDTFDPHEPWDPPQHYLDRYDPDFKGRVFEAPTYGLRRKMGITDRELANIRSRYAAEVTMVDAWFGHFLDKVERLGILDETVIIFTSDHGTQFDGTGDFGMIQKANTLGADGMCMSAGRPMKEPKQFFPISRNIARIPLIIRMPRMRRGKRIKAIVQPWDITATILDIFGIPRPRDFAGKSVLPLITGRGKPWRKFAVVGTNILVQAMNDRWMFTVWRGQRPPALYDLRKDSGCLKNIAGKEPAVCKRLFREIVAFMKQQGVKEQFISDYAAGRCI